MSPTQSQYAGSIPAIALRLTKDAHEAQSAHSERIKELFNQADPDLRLAFEVSPLLPPELVADLDKTEASAAQNDPSYETVGFETWYQVQFTRSANASNPDFEVSKDLTIGTRLVQLVRNLQDSPSVLDVHFLQAAPPPISPDLNPMSKSQGYLNPAPMGIDARAAWLVTGGAGENVTIIDIEHGWNLGHEDLVAAGIDLAAGVNNSDFAHGTAVLGTILMVDNTIGGIGISPLARSRVVSQYQHGYFSTPIAIGMAIELCSAGDFILLEAQEYDPASGTSYWPVEVAAANFQMIKLAVAKDITVIEAAGNGSHNLDQYRTLLGKYIFNRTSPNFADSKAIMVGASTPGAQHTRLSVSNFGSRIDLFAWGSNVATTWTDDAGTDSSYTPDFSGTSSASAIVAGAAANIQGAVKGRLGSTWKPEKIRQKLALGGTNTFHPPGDLIGVMPNLKAVIEDILVDNDGTAITEHVVGKVGKATSDAPVTMTEEMIQA